MLLLDLLIAAVVIFFLFVLITQVIKPAIQGRKLFPDFRSDPLKEEVLAVKEQVETMADQNACLKELGALLKERSDLEKQIAAVSNVEQAKSTEKK